MRQLARYGRMLVVVAVIALMVAVTPGAAEAKKSGPSGLTGTVFGLSGPVAGAVVTAYGLPGAIAGCPESDDAWRAVTTTVTAAAGSYTLTLAPGYYRLGVAPPVAAGASFGYRVDTLGNDGSNVTSWVGYADDIVVPAGPARSNVDVHLSSPRSITGTVTEQGTGQPLAGIEVRAVAAEGSQLQRIAPVATTTASGAFSIDGLPGTVPDPIPATPMNEASRYGLTFVDPTGWHQLWLWWFSTIGPTPPNNTPVVDLLTEATPVRDAALALTARYTGVVRDGRGRPLAGIAVEPFSAFPYPPRYTDAKGRYSVEAGMPDGWVLRFSDPSGRYRTTFSNGYEFASQAMAADPTLTQPNTAGTQKVSNVTLLDGSQMTGLVVYAAEVPAAGAQVQMWRAGSVGDWNNTNGGVSVACDGTFTMTGLWPGTHTVGFSAPRQYGPSVTRTENIPAPRATLTLGRITLPSWIVSGQVNGPTGPLEGIEINLSSSQDSRYAHAVTDNNGQFRVFTPYAVFGSMQVTAHDPLGRSPDQNQSATDNDPWDNQGAFVQFQMAPVIARGIEGYVLDAGGNPVAGVTPHLLYTTYDIVGQPSDSAGHYSASIVYQGGLPAWIVEYVQSGQTLGYYSDSAPTHLVSDISTASAKSLTDPFTVLETVTLP